MIQSQFSMQYIIENCDNYTLTPLPNNFYKLSVKGCKIVSDSRSYKANLIFHRIRITNNQVIIHQDNDRQMYSIEIIGEF